MSIEKFINNISMYNTGELALNPYSKQNEYCEIAKHNLSIYLNQFKMNNNGCLMVGEAPGYNGCRLSGVPFTSEYTLMNENNSIVNQSLKYKVTNPQKFQREASATIVWNVFNELCFYPLMWNAYPFHPHKSGNPKSNRKPVKDEILVGKKFIITLIELFSIHTVIAVGKVAGKSLNEMGIECEIIRHPANGGKNDFRAGLQKLVYELQDKF